MGQISIKTMPLQYIKVKVLPGSKKEGIVKKSVDSFEIKVKPKAERGLATKRALEMLAEHLNIPSKLLRVIKGKHQGIK